MCCVPYKLTYTCNLLSCSESFVIGRSTINLVLKEVVAAIKVVYVNVICWPREVEICKAMLDFKNFNSMPLVHEAINCIHVAI